MKLGRWEYKPTITVFKNIILNHLFDDVNKTNVSCEVFASNSLKKDAGITTMNGPVFRVMLFDASNPYEGFHGVLNIAMVM